MPILSESYHKCPSFFFCHGLIPKKGNWILIKQILKSQKDDKEKGMRMRNPIGVRVKEVAERKKKGIKVWRLFWISFFVFLSLYLSRSLTLLDVCYKFMHFSMYVGMYVWVYVILLCYHVWLGAIHVQIITNSNIMLILFGHNNCWCFFFFCSYVFL